MDESDELRPFEIEALKKTAIEKQPPPGLERRIVKALIGSDLVRPRWQVSGMRIPVLATGLSISAALLVVGILLGAWWQARPVAVTGPKFILLLRSSDAELAGDEQARVREYGSWARSLRARNLLVDAEKLRDESHELKSVNGLASVSTTNAGEPNPIQGYFVISAANSEQAVEIAGQCPHIRYGGIVEVRQIDAGN